MVVRFLSPAPKYPGSFITAGIFLYQSYILQHKKVKSTPGTGSALSRGRYIQENEMD